MEVDRGIFYIFGSFSRKRQDKRKSLILQQSLSAGSSPLHRHSQPCPVHIPARTSAYEVLRGREEWKCGLCGGRLVEPRLLGCLHSFCTRCLQGLHQEGEVALWNDVDAGSIQLEPGGSRSTSGAGSAGSGYESEIIQHSSSEGSWDGENQHRYGIFTRKISGKSVQLLICPTCGHETQLPLGGVSALTLNYVLMRKMARDDGGEDAVLCDLCNTDNKAENRCNQCQAHLCAACSEAHRRRGRSARHALVPLGARPPLCAQHPRSELCVYCATCQQVICRDCCIISHTGHALTNASRAASERARLLRDACDRASDMPRSLQQAMNDLSVQEAEVDVQAAQVEAEIHDWAEQYKRAFDAHVRALSSAASRARARYRIKFAEHSRELSARAVQAREAVKFAEEVLSEAREDELLALSPATLRRLSAACAAPRPAPRCELRFLPAGAGGAGGAGDAGGAGGAQGELPGRLVTSEPDWRTSTLCTDGLQDLRVNCRHEALLELRDARGARAGGAGAAVAGYFRRADSSAAPKLAEVTNNDDGTYTLAICPTSPGAYYFAVTLNNKPIQGSPFPCAVRESKASKGHHAGAGKRDSKCACAAGNGQNGTSVAGDQNSRCAQQSPLYHFSL